MIRTVYIIDIYCSEMKNSHRVFFSSGNPKDWSPSGPGATVEPEEVHGTTVVAGEGGYPQKKGLMSRLFGSKQKSMVEAAKHHALPN